MSALALHDFHQSRGARFGLLNGCEIVDGYQALESEYRALTSSAALLDLSFRGRLCLLGADREKFLHGQVTNDISRLKVGQGCYAALVSGKGKIESDLFVHKLKEELLLDFEPGLTGRVADRLNKYVIAEEVQVVDVAPLYGLLAVAGPAALDVLAAWLPGVSLPSAALAGVVIPLAEGEACLVNNPRFGVPGFDLFVPAEALAQTAQALEEAGRKTGAAWVGFQAAEMVRIENAIPRFGQDMTEANLPQEAEIQDRAVSFAKGCYIGQEIIARIRTYGQVAKALRLIQLDGPAGLPLPAAGTKILADGKEVGFVTSASTSPKTSARLVLGYVRKESNAVGTKLALQTDPASTGTIARVPYQVG